MGGPTEFLEEEAGGGYVYLALRVIPAHGYPGRKTAVAIGVWTEKFEQARRALADRLVADGVAPGELPDGEFWLPVELLPAPIHSNKFVCRDWAPVAAAAAPERMEGFLLRGLSRGVLSEEPLTVLCATSGNLRTWLSSAAGPLSPGRRKANGRG